LATAIGTSERLWNTLAFGCAKIPTHFRVEPRKLRKPFSQNESRFPVFSHDDARRRARVSTDGHVHWSRSCEPKLKPYRQRQTRPKSRSPSKRQQRRAE